MKSISDTSIIKQFTRPPDGKSQAETGSISTFPTSPLDMPSATFESSLKRREENHRKLIQWIRKNLEPDVHYGRIHIAEDCSYARAGIAHQCRDFGHYSGLTLFKAGAEKILGVMGLTAHFPNLYQWEMACLHKQEITQVLLKCELKTHNGTVVAEGSGARHIRQDGWNLNTSIKMAQKSAMIDATIRVAGLTGIFIKTNRHTARNNLPYDGVHSYNLPSGEPCHHSTYTDAKPITEKQKSLIIRLAGRKGLTTESLERLVQEHFSKSMKDLSRIEAHQLIQHING
ncbi:MAG: hypothetical protein HUN04_04455 [Desulfobacter sp.]|nr:MAG: hypothetical protein HUN04_04455 [Desulfobacter sp.]